MKRETLRNIAIIAVAFGCGIMVASLLLSAPGSSGTAPDREVIFQVGTFDAILESAYDGTFSSGDLLTRGDFGIGTFDALDGEMIVLDGVVYDVRPDGVAYLIPPGTTTPFATVTFFDPDRVFTVSDLENLTRLSESIDRELPSRNLFYAVKIEGTFPYVKTRSVPRQEKPYPRLVDAVAHQSVFEFRNVSGTVVGFSTPGFVKGINVPGFHLHFLTADRSRGGHILDIAIGNATVTLDTTSGFAMELPTGGAFIRTNLTKDLSSDMETVEKGTAG